MTNTSAQALNPADPSLLIQQAEEHYCTCGAGHGSLEGHVEWCAWLTTEWCYWGRAVAGLPRPDTVPSEGVATDWQDISTAPTGDEIFIAYCPPDAAFPDGRQMFVRGSALVSMRKPKTSNHLQFPATHWRWQAAPPALTPIESNEK